MPDPIPGGTTRRRFLAMLGAAGVLAACGGGPGEGDGGTGGESPRGGASGESGGSGESAGGDRTVLALGEEYVLADLLALGVRPIASSANVVLDEGFAGVEEDTAGIESLSSSDPNLERLAAYRADVVVVNEFVLDYVGREPLEALGDELVVVPDDDPEERLLILGDAFGARSEAEALITDLDEAVAEARASLGAEGRGVSVATVYSGPTVAIWVDGPTEVPAMLLDLGFTLRPGAGDVTGVDDIGRLYISNEQMDLLDADVIVSLQSEMVEGELDALDAIADDPLWARLPAVEAGNVVTVDRLGYPGIAGRRRLVDDLVELLG